MNLGELCQDVYTLTHRDDLVGETQLAIRTAARKFHLIDFWFRDLQEKVVPFDATSQNFIIDISVQFPNFRKFAYIRPTDYSTGTPKDRYITPVAPDNVFDEFKQPKTDKYYVAGTRMNMKTSDSEQSFLIGWYSYPNLNLNNFGSWIADMYPEIIIEEAAGRILYVIGMVDEGNKFVDPRIGSVYHPITGHLQALRINELEPQAR